MEENSVTPDAILTNLTSNAKENHCLLSLIQYFRLAVLFASWKIWALMFFKCLLFIKYRN